MILAGLQKTTLIDFPGRVSCTVFISGCNFRCPFCYSPELVLPEKIIKHPQMSEKDFFSFLKKRKGLLDGVVICGGEPTINRNLPDFCEKIKKMGFLVKLDTNGSNSEMLKLLIEKKLIDYVAMDIKAPLGLKSEIRNPKHEINTKYPEAELSVRYGAGKIQNTPKETLCDPTGQAKYSGATGVNVDLDRIRESVEIIKNSGINYEFRTTVVPGIHTKEDIMQIAKDIQPAKKYYLQNFRADKNLNPTFKKIRPYSKDWMDDVKKEIKGFFEVCGIR